MFIDHCLSFLFPLCFLSFFDLRLLATSVVSPNFSFTTNKQWNHNNGYIVVPVVNASVLTLFILFYLVKNLHFLYKVIFIKTIKFIFHWHPVPILSTRVHLLPKTSKLFGFPFSLLWAYPMKVIPETRRAH